MNLLVKNKWLVILIGTLICYWVLCTDLFVLKHDVLVHFFPVRYQIGQALQSGNFPFWCPYFNLGMPIHGDMQAGVWNPLVLLLGFLTAYESLYVVQLELLLYFFLGGIGFFNYLKVWDISSKVRLLVTISFVCSGFMTCSMTHLTWIAGMASFPFVLLYFHQVVMAFSLRSSIGLVLSFSFFFLSAYPGMIIIACYFLLGYAFFLASKNDFWEVVKRLIYLVPIGIVIIIICSPALVSYFDFLPQYSRGGSQTVAYVNRFPFYPSSLATLILPFALDKNLPTDILHQSVYIGLFAIILFIRYFSLKVARDYSYLFIVLIVSLFASFGALAGVRSLLYYLPLMDTFQNPSVFRFLIVFLLLLFSALFIDKRKFNFEIDKRFVYSLFGLFLIIALVVIVFNWDSVFPIALNDSQNLKAIIDSIRLPQKVILNCLIFLALLSVFFFVKRNSQLSDYKLLLIFTICEMTFFSTMNLPYTAFGNQSAAYFNSTIKTFSNGFPIPGKPIGVSYDSEIYNQYFYSKKVVHDTNMNYIGTTKNYDAWQKNKAAVEKVELNKIVYFEKEKGSALSIQEFSNNHILLNVNSNNDQWLYYSQSFNSNWIAEVDNVSVPIVLANINFMKVKVPIGKHKIRFVYHPIKIIYLMNVSLLVLLVLIVLLLLKKKQIIRPNHN